jgi:hypothetical protein
MALLAAGTPSAVAAAAAGGSAFPEVLALDAPLLLRAQNTLQAVAAAAACGHVAGEFLSRAPPAGGGGGGGGGGCALTLAGAGARLFAMLQPAVEGGTAAPPDIAAEVAALAATLAASRGVETPPPDAVTRAVRCERRCISRAVGSAAVVP